MRPRPEPVSKTHCLGSEWWQTAAAVFLPRPLPRLAGDVIGNSLTVFPPRPSSLLAVDVVGNSLTILLPRPLPLLAVDVVGNSLDCNDDVDVDDDDDDSGFDVELVDNGVDDDVD